MGIIRLRNTITIEIDNRTEPMQVSMKVEHEIPLPQMMLILHSLQGRFFQQLMAGPPPASIPSPPMPQAPPADPFAKVD
jgi:hypothetical protein